MPKYWAIVALMLCAAGLLFMATHLLLTLHDPFSASFVAAISIIVAAIPLRFMEEDQTTENEDEPTGL